MSSSMQTKFSLLFRAVFLLGAFMFAFSNANADVFSDIFELDGNPSEDVAGAPDDWEVLYGGGGSALAHIVTIPDQVGLPGFVGPDNMFHHGCKDVNDLLNCYVKAADKTLPDKNDFENGSIAIYNLSGLPAPVPINGLPDGYSGFHQNGDIIIVMQGDVFAPNGDASLGGWFFQEHIPAPAPGESFSVGRTPGDIFIEADFTGGGSDVSFAVYTWDPNAQKNLTQLLSGEGLRCGDITNPLGCAIANDETIGPVDTVWPYTNKGEDPFSTQYATTTFFEGAFNLSAALRLLGLEQGCFADFLYETRASHSVDAKLHDYILGSLPMCALEITKTGPTLSKPTDDTQYTITITNTGIVPLTKTSINDTLLGNLTGDAGCGATLNPTESCIINVNRTVLATDPDPLPNIVTAIYNYGSDSVQAEDSHSVDLFVPAIDISKTGTAVSKAGDDVTYTFTITNQTDGDPSTPAYDGTAPNMLLTSISDTLLGDLSAYAGAAGCNSLAVGGSCTFDVNRTVLPTDPDPLPNTVTVHYSPEGFPNDVDDSDSHSVDLFAPAVQITKTGDNLSKIGDNVTYTFTITNKSDGNLNTAAQDGTAPDLILANANDSIIGSLGTQATTAGCDRLAMGESCTFQIIRPVQAGDPDPLVNIANVLYHPEGFPNNIADSDSHTVNLFQPSMTLTKICKDPGDGDNEVTVGQDAQFVFTLNNTSSTDTPALNLISASDTVLGDIATHFPDPLPLGESIVTINYTTMAPGLLSNTVDVVYQVAGFSNTLTKTDSASCEVVAGNEGCTPGYWKTHQEQWDGVAPDATTTIQYTDLFNATFGVTPAQSGLPDTATLLEAVNLNGGGLYALDRHAAAALASADAVAYSFSVQGVIDLYRDAVGADPGPESIYSALAKLSAANEKYCPLN